MSFFDIFKKKEVRAQDPSWDALSGLNTTTGRMVNPRMAETLAAVSGCVQVISSSIASLPVYVYRQGEKGRDTLTAHPLARLIRRGPNEHMTWPDFIEFVMAQVLLRGNALAEIVTDNSGRIAALKPIPWEWASVGMLSNGKLYYDVQDVVSIYGARGRVRRLLEDEVFHLRDRTDDTLIGKSRIQRACSAIENAMDAQTSASALLRNGLNPSGAVTLEGKLDKEQKAYLRRNIEEMHAGPANRAKFLILDQGLDYKPMSITPEDAELLESRRFSVEEICRIFQCPPPLVQVYENNTFTNAETAGKWFSQFTISPWCRKIEAEHTRSVFSASARDNTYLEFDLSGFQRGDHAARWEGHQIAVQNGILTANEVREIEGWNPLPGGDNLKQMESKQQ